MMMGKFSVREISMPGYKPAYLTITKDSAVQTTIPFLISPSTFLDTRSNVNQISKTNGGWFIMRSGPEPIQLSISGYMLDMKNQMERHQFLVAYNTFIEDKKNNDMEYENPYSCTFTCEGRSYYGIVKSINFSKSGVQPFLYQYSILFISTNEKYIFDPKLVTGYDSLLSSMAGKTTTVSAYLSGKTYKTLGGD